jgi:cytoskeletal protein CcmA (bactofilin family)
MGATYTRQSSSAIVDGGVIEASDINAEFNQILAAFAVTSGHTHDGTDAEGGPITKLLGTAITIGDGTAGTDIAVTFDGETGDGVLTWMEDEDYFQFSDDLLLTTTEKLQFRDTAIYINSSADGQLDLVADTEIQIAATTIDINGAVALNGAITGATNITLSGELDAATLDISGDADIDGTLETDALSINGTTVTSTAAELNLVDGITAGTVSASLAVIADSNKDISGFRNVTLTGELDAATLDISGDADIDGTLEADAITINGTTLAETISDTVGAMVSSNTETGISVTYDDTDNTLDFVISALPLSSIDIDGGTDIGAAIVDADLFIIDDGAGGTNRKVTASRLKTYAQTGISTAYDDLTTGDAAVTVATSAGNITIDAQGDDTDIIFKGTDGGVDTTFLTIDGSAAGAATFNDKIVATELDISGNVDIDGTLETDALSIASTTITATAAEINLIDGDTARGTTAVVDADGILHNDGGTMRMTSAATFKTYFQTGISSAADDITTGDAAVNITTSSGNITIDAAANDSDIIFKGTDNSSDITMLTLDGSEAGKATFNDQVVIGDGKLVLNSTAVTSTAAELNLLDGVSGLVQADLTKLAAVDSTAAELNIVDGGTSATSTTVADADRVVLNDNGTMVQVAMTDIKTYIGGGTQWQAVKTGNYTASAGEGVFANTTSTAWTLTLPAGSIGDEVSFIDYAGTFDSNALTIAANGSEKINGSTADLTVSVERAANTLVYTDGTQGWLLKNK